LGELRDETREAMRTRYQSQEGLEGAQGNAGKRQKEGQENQTMRI